MRDGHTLPPTETSDAVQAEVARLLTTPDLLIESQGIGLLCDSDQIRQLRKFRGFITKVMHNGIRKFIPKTMAALNILEIELEFYVAISPDYQRLRAQGPIRPEKHLRWYESALGEWVDETNIEGGELVRDILAHELVQQHARQPTRKTMLPFKTGAIRVEGEVVLRRYTHDVPTTFRDLGEGTLDPIRTALETPMNLAYWLKSNGGLVVTEVDDLTARVLSLVDGKRTLSDIAASFAARGLSEVDAEVLSGIFARLAPHTPLHTAD